MIIQFTQGALNDLTQFAKNNQFFIKKKLITLQQIERIQHHPKIKKLKFLPYFRYRCGDFRVFFTQDGEILLIQKIRRRSEKTYKY